MKPVTINAFYEVLESYLNKFYLSSHFTNATKATLSMVVVDSQVEGLAANDDEEKYEFLDNIYEWTFPIDNLKDYIKNRYEEDIEDSKELGLRSDNSSEFFEIGNSNEFEYENLDDFLNDVDYDLVNKIINKCWAQACSSGSPFPSDEYLQDWLKPKRLKKFK